MAARKADRSFVERAAEGERERKVRDAVIVEAKHEPAWLARSALKVAPLVSDDGPVGLTVYTHFTDRQRVEALSAALERTTTAALGVPCRWVAVQQGSAA